MGIFDWFTGPPSPEKFSTIAVNGLRAQGYAHPIEVDQAQFRLLIGADGKQIFNLTNFYRDYCRVGRAERPQVMQAYLKSMMAEELPSSFAAAKARLLPVLRSRSMIEYVALSATTDADAARLPAAQPLSADAAIMLAFDTEHAMMTLTAATLAGWDVGFADALAAASDNLRDRTVSCFDQIAPGLFLGTWNDSYDTSRLLFPDVLYQLGVAGEPVAMIPTRNRLLVASANDRDAQLAMIALARQFADEEGRQVSALMYHYQQGRPVEYLPVYPDVLARLSDWRRKILAEDYAGQKDMLAKAHAQAGVDVFVASFQVIASAESGREASFSVWTEDVDTLLPETDLVALVSTAELDGEKRTGPPKLVAWNDLLEATGPFAREADRYPVRYRPVNFPDKAAREALPATEL